MPSLRLPAFAKINLCLHLRGRRTDGYTELRTIYQAISLHDELRLAILRGRSIELAVESSVEISRADRAALASRQNLVARALESLRHELGLRTGLHVRLTKHIPVGRGLGGGSSDAAAAMLGLLCLVRRRIELERLLPLAARLGADVPFFLLGGRALGVGRGDEVYPLLDSPKRHLVVISPQGIAVPTRDAYRWAAARLTNSTPARKLWRFCALCWSAQGSELANDFEPAVFRRHPRLGRLKRELLRRGAAEAALAGSGSAVFGVFPNPAQARRAACGFLNDQVFIVETLSREEYVRALRGRRGGLP